jgi:hypothetical protein
MSSNTLPRTPVVSAENRAVLVKVYRLLIKLAEERKKRTTADEGSLAGEPSAVASNTHQFGRGDY